MHLLSQKTITSVTANVPIYQILFGLIMANGVINVEL